MIKILKFSLFIIIFTFFLDCSLQNSGGFFENKIEEFEKEIEKKFKIVFTPQKNLTKKFLELFQKNLVIPILIEKWTKKLNYKNFIPNLFYKNKKIYF